LNADRNIGFVATVSARALNVASFNSFSGFDHHDDTWPQPLAETFADWIALLVAAFPGSRRDIPGPNYLSPSIR